MRQTFTRQFAGASLATALALLPSWADASSLGENGTPTARRARDIIATLEKPRSEADESWFVRHVSLNTRGVEYVQHVKLDDRWVQLRLRGPVYRSTRKRKYGLALEIRF